MLLRIHALIETAYKLHIEMAVSWETLERQPGCRWLGPGANHLEAVWLKCKYVYRIKLQNVIQYEQKNIHRVSQYSEWKKQAEETAGDLELIADKLNTF